MSSNGNPPNPNWKSGQKIVSPVNEMVDLDPAKMDGISSYKLLIGGVVPRPIAFVSTINDKGAGNLAPFSFFNAVTGDPPTVLISVSAKSDGTKKDTLRNIELNKQFVVNTVSEWLAEPMNQCSAEYPYGVDEMTTVGLTPLPSSKVKPMRVKESPVQLECELFDTMKVGATTIVVGRIVMFHVSKQMYENGRLDILQLKPLARLAGSSYGRVREIFDLIRPKA